MWDVEKIKEDLKEALSEYRYLHSLRTAEVAKDLAEHYGYDSKKAYVTALVHDIAKEYSEEENQKMIQKYQLDEALLTEENQKFAHGFIGAALVKEKYHFEEEMLEAIAYHTAGKKDMNWLTNIVALADKIEPGKDYEGIEQERKLAFESLEEAFLYCLEMKQKKLEKRKELIHPQTKETIEYLKMTLKKQ